MSFTNGTLMAVGTTGAGLTTLASGLSGVQDLAVNATDIYWTNAGSGTVMQIPRSGGMPVEVGSGAQPRGITLDAVNVYWADEGSATLWKAPLAGGSPVPLIMDTSSGIYSIAVDATSIYWLPQGILKKAPLAGGTPTVLAITPGAGGGTLDLAVDATSVYWTVRIGPDSGFILKTAK